MDVLPSIEVLDAAVADRQYLRRNFANDERRNAVVIPSWPYRENDVPIAGLH